RFARAGGRADAAPASGPATPPAPPASARGGGARAALRRPATPVGLRTHESLLITPRQPAGAGREGEFNLTERTLVLIKPDGVRRGLIGDVLSRIERKGLQIVAMDVRTLETSTAQTHYAEHSGKPFFGS